MERERLREREPEAAENIYERTMARQQEILEAARGWEQIVRGRERRWEPSPWGRVKWLTHPRLHTAMRTMSHYLTELPPGGRSTRVRHLWETVGFVLSGRGYSIVDGVRYDWEPEDALCLPSGCVYQHFNPDPATPAQIIWGSMLPLAWLLGQAGIEELPDEGEPPPLIPAPAPKTVSGRRSLYDALQAEAAAAAQRRGGRIHVPARTTPWELNRQARNNYYTGHHLLHVATQLVRVFLQDLPAGPHSGRHRHFPEAALYGVEGRGYSIVDGVRHDWEAGDLNIVHINSTHQHFNADPDRRARLLALHPGAVGGLFDWLGQYELEQVEVGSLWQEQQAAAGD